MCRKIRRIAQERPPQLVYVIFIIYCWSLRIAEQPFVLPAELLFFEDAEPSPIFSS